MSKEIKIASLGKMILWVLHHWLKILYGTGQRSANFMPQLRREKQRAGEITCYWSSCRIKDTENPGFIHLRYLFACSVDFITCSHASIRCFSTCQNGSFILSIKSVFCSSIHLFTYRLILSILSCCLQAICQTLEHCPTSEKLSI